MRKVKQKHRDDSCAREENDRCDQSGNIFSYYQHFAANGTQEVEVQTSVNDVSAKKIHEYPGTTKEDHRTKDQPSVKDRKDHVVLSEVLPLTTRRREGSKQGQGNDGKQRQEIKQNRAPAQKVLFNLEPKDSP